MKAIIAILMVLVLAQTAAAQTQNETEEALRIAAADIQQMRDAGFSALKAEDLLAEAQNLFDAQRALEKEGGKPDYSHVMPRVQEISRIKAKAFQANDEIRGLEAALEGPEGIDLMPVRPILSEAREAFAAGRFEESIALVDEAYKKISELQATTSRIAALLSGWSGTLVRFVTDHWLFLLLLGIILAVMSALFGRQIGISLTKAKLSKLNLEKGVIRDLTKDAQTKYFGGDMPQSTYNIKINKYGEMTRDLNRRILALEERLKRQGEKEEKEKKQQQQQQKKEPQRKKK